MALHDPVQDEVNRQIQGERISTKGDPDLRGETSRGAAFLLRQAARLKFDMEGPSRLRAKRLAQEETLRNAESKRILRDRQGQASLATANAALAKARPGANNIGEEGLAALGFSPEDVTRFSGKITRPTARIASTARSQRDAAALREQSERTANELKRIDTQRQRNARTNQAKAKEARLSAQSQLSALDKGLQDASPEDIKQIKAVFDQLVGDQGVALPADQIETYQAAAAANLPADATDEELGEEATRLAEEDGFSFLP